MRLGTTKTIHRRGVCPISGERCIITAKYQQEYRFHADRHVKLSASCSLGPCDRQDKCREYNHFPEEYNV